MSWKMREVVYTEDYRGEDDDELYLLFKGIYRLELMTALSILAPANGKGVCEQMIFTNESCEYLNGKTPRQVAVKIINRDDNFCSLPDFFLLVESRIRSEFGYKVKKVGINTFINL